MRFGAKVLYLQSVRALLRFSAIMRLEGAGVNGDAAASQFLDEPTNTVENSRALLPDLLAHLYLIENIQDAKLNYDQLAVQAGLVIPVGQAAAAAPLKSALTKRKAAVEFDDYDDSLSRSSSPVPPSRSSSPAPAAPRPLGRKCFRHLCSELRDKNRQGKICSPCHPRGGGPCPSTHFTLSSWTQAEMIHKVNKLPADAAGDKDRVLALLKPAPSTLFKQG